MKAGSSRCGLLLRIMCALALVFAAFAHRPVQPAFPGDFDIAAYTLPDGTIPVICLIGTDGKPAGNAGNSRCEFCRIASATALPEPPGDFVPCAIEVTLAFNPPIIAAPTRQAFSGNAPVRGPPAGNHNS